MGGLPFCLQPGRHAHCYACSLQFCWGLSRHLSRQLITIRSYNHCIYLPLPLHSRVQTFLFWDCKRLNSGFAIGTNPTSCLPTAFPSPVTMTLLSSLCSRLSSKQWESSKYFQYSHHITHVDRNSGQKRVGYNFFNAPSYYNGRRDRRLVSCAGSILQILTLPPSQLARKSPLPPPSSTMYKWLLYKYTPPQPSRVEESLAIMGHLERAPS